MPVCTVNGNDENSESDDDTSCSSGVSNTHNADYFLASESTALHGVGNLSMIMEQSCSDPDMSFSGNSPFVFCIFCNYYLGYSSRTILKLLVSSSMFMKSSQRQVSYLFKLVVMVTLLSLLLDFDSIHVETLHLALVLQLDAATHFTVVCFQLRNVAFSECFEL